MVLTCWIRAEDRSVVHWWGSTRWDGKREGQFSNQVFIVHVHGFLAVGIYMIVKYLYLRRHGKLLRGRSNCFKLDIVMFHLFENSLPFNLQISIGGFRQFIIMYIGVQY